MIDEVNYTSPLFRKLAKAQAFKMFNIDVDDLTSEQRKKFIESDKKIAKARRKVRYYRAAMNRQKLYEKRRRLGRVI